MQLSEFRSRFKAKKLGKAASKIQRVSSKRINRVLVDIIKTSAGFTVIIDGEELDTYRTKAEAEKFSTQFVKQLKG
jgi:hypothetical protein